MTRIDLVRHGQTDWNLERRIQGSSDIPLNDTGREQAREVGRQLARRVRRGGWTTVYASPLSRARETAELIAAELGLAAPTALPGLEERSYGAAEGMNAVEIAAAFGDDWDGVPGWEPNELVIARALPPLAALAEAHPGARVLVVTHGAVIGSIVRHVTAEERPRRGEVIDNGSIHEFAYRDGQLELVRFNVEAADDGFDDDSRDDTAALSAS